MNICYKYIGKKILDPQALRYTPERFFKQLLIKEESIVSNFINTGPYLNHGYSWQLSYEHCVKEMKLCPHIKKQLPSCTSHYNSRHHDCLICWINILANIEKAIDQSSIVKAEFKQARKTSLQLIKNKKLPSFLKEDIKKRPF